MTKIQVRRGTTAQWATAATVLAAGEPGQDTTTGVIKIGDGSTAWASLLPAGGPTQAIRVVDATSSTLTGTLVAGHLTPIDATAGAAARTLPAASSVAAGGITAVKKADTGTNVVTVNRAGSDLIFGTGSGSTSKTLTLAGEAVTFVSDGVSKWTVQASDTPSGVLASTYVPLAGAATISGLKDFTTAPTVNGQPMASALNERGTWVTGTAYVVGDVVSDVAAGQRYACKTSHTAGTFATDLAASKWTTTGPSKGYVDATVSAGAVDATTSTKGIVQLAGDLAGTATSPTVAKVNGVAVTGTPTAGQVPTATSGSAATWQDQNHLGLTPTAVKTADYTAVAGDFVPVDTTSGNVTVTFPTAPADRTVVAVKHVTQGGTNTVTLALGGSDKFNTTTGATTRTLTILSQAILTQYKSSTAVWYVVADDLPLSGLDSRYDASGAAAAVSATRGAANGLASLDSSTLVPTAQMGTGTADSTKVLQGDRSWGTAVTLAQSGQTPSQAPVVPTTAGGVGTLAYSARADHAHPSYGAFAFFGSGADSAATFDGSNAVTGCSRSGTTYTATRDLYYTAATITSGVTLNMDGYKLFVRGTLAMASGTGTITATPLAANGTNNSLPGGLTATATYGAGNGRNRTLGPAVRGTTGVTGVGANPTATASTMAGLSPVTGTSGNGGTGTSGAGGTGAGHGLTTTNNDPRVAIASPPYAFMGMTYNFDTANAWQSGSNSSNFGPVCGGKGGASGAGDGTNAGGAGGCGGNVVLVNAIKVTGTVNLTAPGGAAGTPTTGNCGGGGGGTGGVVLLNSLDLTGWTGTATAAAGTAGTGVGSGGNGTDGAAGFVQTTTWA